MKNAHEESFDLIEVLDKTVLFTNLRIDRNTVPDGLYCYDLRHGDSDDSEPCSIEKNVLVNHMGTIISKEPFEFGDKDYVSLEDGINFLPAPTLTLHNFITIPSDELDVYRTNMSDEQSEEDENDYEI